MLSILITARNEVYLQKTIEDILMKAEDKIEVIVILDGYIPDPQIDMKDDRVIFVHYGESIGQRAAINEAARRAKGKYIMKLDAHCAVDKAFDVKLARDCEYDWTVIPRMYNLDIETWKPKLHKRTDYMYISSPKAEKPFRAMYYSHQPDTDKEIDDTMCCMGPCWFMHKKRFWELGGLDEGHGGWGQMGIEVALKAWLSGGYLKVNKKTWFAHWFRGGGGPGFPYQISGNDQERARKYSQDLWLNDKWALAKRKLDWVVKKFDPPGWDNDLTILFYTANRIRKEILNPVVRSLKRHGYPIISISQEPMNLGKNIVVPKEYSLQNIYKQVLTGAKAATTKYVALCEDDCLYVKEHFKHRPKKFGYNLNRWLLHLDDGIFTYRKRPILSQCIAERKTLIENLEERLTKEVPDKYCGEMGVFDKRIGIKEYDWETFETKEPNMIVCHNKNIMGRKLFGKDKEPTTKIPNWGEADYWVNKFKGRVKKYGRGAKYRKQHSYIGSVIISTDELCENRMEYADPRKPESLVKFLKVFPPFIKQVAEGKKFTNKELEKLPYYQYLIEKLNPSDRDPLTSKGKRHSINLMKDAVKLFEDIKKNGLRNPLDMWRIGDKKLVLHRGGRRLEILKLLGYKTIPCRVFKSREHFIRFAPDRYAEPDNSIHGLAMKQFIKLRELATDKYWVHGYTKLYDKHIGHLRDKEIKLLEIGVLRGASLLLWKEAFPKAQIYGIDKNTRIWQKFLKGQNIKVFVGRQEDTDFLKEVAKDGLYDVIIDDGGHKPFEQQPSFEVLWDNLSSGGFYIIEDLYGNYKKDVARQAKRQGLKSTVDVIKDLIDDMHFKMNIKSITFYYNICFIEKI